MTREEENTEWISTWVLNDPDCYCHAVDAAFHGVEKFKSEVMNILKEAGENTVAGYTHSQMTGDDYDYVNWKEIREALLN